MNGTGIGNETTRTRNRGLVEYAVASLVMLIALACPVAAARQDSGPVLAWALTFLPGLVVVFQASRFGDPRQALPFLLYSTAVRVAAALGGGLLAIWMIPALNQESFLLWLAGMYAVALAAEIYLTLSINSMWIPVRYATRNASPSNRRHEGDR